MKIRIKGNSLRYRLTRSDVAKIELDGWLEESTNFAGQPLTYKLLVNDEKELSSDYLNNEITIYVPKIMINDWADSDVVGFDNTYGDLHLLIEKDFTCLDNVEEDQSDNYPNPLLKHYE